jgi:hypothetical protein
MVLVVGTLPRQLLNTIVRYSKQAWRRWIIFLIWGSSILSGDVTTVVMTGDVHLYYLKTWHCWRRGTAVVVTSDVLLCLRIRFGGTKSDEEADYKKTSFISILYLPIYIPIYILVLKTLHRESLRVSPYTQLHQLEPDRIIRAWGPVLLRTEELFSGSSSTRSSFLQPYYYYYLRTWLVPVNFCS